MTNRLEYAKNLCLEGIRDGEAEWVTTDFFDTDGDGRIIEHWVNAEPVPPEDEWANSGKF